MRKKLLFISLFLALAFTAVIAVICFANNPKRIFKELFDFELPPSSQIIYSDCSAWMNYAYMKIQIDKDEATIIADGLLEHFGSGQAINDYDDIWPMQNIPWWDLNKAEIIVAYTESTCGRIAKTKSTFAIVTKDKNNQFFVYVVRV